MRGLDRPGTGTLKVDGEVVDGEVVDGKNIERILPMILH